MKLKVTVISTLFILMVGASGTLTGVNTKDHLLSFVSFESRLGISSADLGRSRSNGNIIQVAKTDHNGRPTCSNWVGALAKLADASNCSA